MPPSIAINSAIMTVKVRCAVCTLGSRNARTPLLTASTPVIAVQPLENDCSNSQALAAATTGAAAGGGISTATGCPPASTDLKTPQAIVANRLPIKMYVG